MDFFPMFPAAVHALRLGISLWNDSAAAKRTEERHNALLPEEYQVRRDTGFFPARPPPRLGGEFCLWEQGLDRAKDVLRLDNLDELTEAEALAREDWRNHIRSWPVLSVSCLHDETVMQQRAHLVLAWLVQFYAHTTPHLDRNQSITIPRSLALPLVEVSRMLKIAPVLTFADTVLWNWDPITDGSLVTMENVRYSQTFSGTEDESNFYIFSARAELRGVELLQLFTEYHSIPDHSNPHAITRISRILHRMTTVVNDITDIMRSVRDEVDPHVFYAQVRPWYEGSRAGGPSDLAWVYDGVPNSDQLDLSGPSAGQSSVMHALDIFLDVDHKLQQSRSPAPSAQNKKSDLGFMERMRRYMPGRHRDYLNALGSTPRPLRELARRTPALREPYDTVISALKHLRDMHMRIAVIYIVSMSRSQPLEIPQCPVAAAMIKRQQEQSAAAAGPVRGTGGNALSVLLKAGRDATSRAALKGNI